MNDVAGVASSLVRGLRDLGVETELMTITKWTDRRSRVTKMATVPFGKIRDLVTLSRLVRQKQFDIVHIHYAAHAWMAWALRLPYFLHVHGSDVREGIWIPGVNALSTRAIRKATCVLFVTPDLREYVERVRPDHTFLPDPIDTEMFAPRPNQDEFLAEVLCISKLDRAKGVEQFLETVELIWQARPDTTVGLFDFGNTRQLAAPFIERHRDDPRLRLFSRIPHHKMPEFLGSFDVILGQQSAKVGALGVSELEAMACAKPVVCHFAFPEAYSEPPPILVSKTAINGCQQVIQLLEDPDLGASIGQKGRDWVIRHHGLQAVVRTLLRIYHRYV